MSSLLNRYNFAGKGVMLTKLLPWPDNVNGVCQTVADVRDLWWQLSETESVNKSMTTAASKPKGIKCVCLSLLV